MTMYPQSYHAACNHLVSFGGHRFAQAGRLKVARALRDLRRIMPREQVQRERYHMLFISGQFPVKGSR
jgi:hypothetical protein